MMQSSMLRKRPPSSSNLFVDVTLTSYDSDSKSEPLSPPRQHRRIERAENKHDGTRRLRCVVFDFDSTLSTPKFLERFGQWAIADKPFLLDAMTADEVVANFGGVSRVAALQQMLALLRRCGVAVYIVSIGFKRAIVPQLETVGLGAFFDAHRVYGQDSAALRRAKFVKAELIASLMRDLNLEPDELLFVDDSARHLAEARSRGTCRTFQVSGQGLSTDEIRQIASLVPAEFGKSHRPDEIRQIPADAPADAAPPGAALLVGAAAPPSPPPPARSPRDESVRPFASPNESVRRLASCTEIS
ncbi:hypothetical protein M885DRAFT_506151 [Pelagophyceae sp. CCMP2097]|nr:hypothetical protein M885DRAFT_506151 [Pelagophyceae sp. CCMP2097]|mmetsp:Transcript_23261/g.79412  ORF Transcript_23261/g.79412 Transcript_23261/m.79412 type:complete len:301 (-) Transcript_23261:77-979(-)